MEPEIQVSPIIVSPKTIAGRKNKNKTPPRAGRKSNKRLIFIIVLVVAVVAFLFLAWWMNRKKMLEIAPQSALVSYEQAITGVADGKDLSLDQRKNLYNQAITGLEAELKTDPQNTTLMMQIASAYYNSGNLNKAIEYIQKAIAVDATNASLQNTLGMFLNEKGDTAGAERAFHKAIEIDPQDSNPRINLENLLKK